MREIKFRAWSRRDLCWCGGFSIHMSGLFNDIAVVKMVNGKRVAFSDWKDLSEQDDIQLMQYTGIKDKNGVEIYEGDILKFAGKAKHKLSIVKWHNGRLGWRLNIIHPKVDNSWNVIKGQEQEVIGNIYNNPELLK